MPMVNLQYDNDSKNWNADQKEEGRQRATLKLHGTSMIKRLCQDWILVFVLTAFVFFHMTSVVDGKGRGSRGSRSRSYRSTYGSSGGSSGNGGGGNLEVWEIVLIVLGVLGLSFLVGLCRYCCKELDSAEEKELTSQGIQDPTSQSVISDYPKNSSFQATPLCTYSSDAEAPMLHRRHSPSKIEDISERDPLQDEERDEAEHPGTDYSSQCPYPVGPIGFGPQVLGAAPGDIPDVPPPAYNSVVSH